MKRSRLALLLAPAGVFLLLSAVYLISGLFPYGENTLAWGDMTQQVIPLLLELKQILLGPETLSFTQLTAGGMNFFGVFLFFLSSPFSFLVLLIPDTELILWVNVLVLLKLMLAGWSAQWFFWKQYPKLPAVWTVLLGISYALCGYGLLFFQNLVWLDVMVLFPLLMLALGRMIRTGRMLPFVLALSGMILLNLYLSYMVILFLLLFCGLYGIFCAPKEKRGRFALRLGGSAVLAVLLTAPAWLPFLLQYSQSARGVSLVESLSGGKFFVDIRTTFCILTATPLLLAASIFLVRDGRRRQRLLLWMLLLMFLPLCIDPINRMWHTGSYQAFPARYGLLTVFIGLLLTARVLSDAPPEDRLAGGPGIQKRALAACVGLTVLMAAAAAAVTLLMGEELDDYVHSLWVSSGQFAGVMLLFVAGFVAAFAVLFCWKSGWLRRRAAAGLLCGVVAVSGIFSGGVFLGQASRSPESWQQAVELSGALEEDGFSRVKLKEKSFDVNLLGGMGYPNLGHYTSLTTERYLYGMKKLGYSAYWMEVSPVGGTLLTDALLCNRYIIEPLDASHSDGVVASNDRYQLRELALSLPLGVVTPGALPATLSAESRAEVQRVLFSSVFGRGDTLLTEYQPDHLENAALEETSGHYRIQKGVALSPSVLVWEIPVEGEQALYFDCFDALSTALTEPVNGSFEIEVNGVEWASGYPAKNQNGLLYLGTFSNETVTVRATLNKEVEARSFGIYGLDTAELASAVESAPTAGLTVEGGSIRGTCQGEEGEWLFLAIPYDAGFTATVNGEETEIQQVFDCWMAVPLQDGENVISLSYRLPGWNAGLLLCGAGAAATLLVVLCQRRKPPRPRPRLEQAGWIALVTAGGLAAAAVYLLPVALWLYAHYL